MTDPALAERLLILNSVLYIDDGGLKSGVGGSVYAWAERLAANPRQLDQVIAARPAEMTEAEIRGLLSSIRADRDVYDKMTITDVNVTPGSPKYPGDGSTVVNATIAYGDQPIILFKGTGGDMEWRDNGEAGYAGVTDTAQQQAALAYFQQQMELFPGQQAIVSGHSKGGNKAQYVGVLGGDQVASVHSFDGQGFNQAFLLKYSDEIARNAARINSVSSEHDFVNILFHALPGSSQYYVEAPWKNTGGWADSAKRWHSPATMLTAFGGRLILNLDPGRTRPDDVMAQADDFIAFAQRFMSKDDFAYLCYFAMSKFMTNPDAYGTPLAKPDGFDQRFLSLLRNYLDLKGVDPQDVFFSSSGLGQFAGSLLGLPAGGAAAGAGTGAALALLLASVPSYGYTTVPRDFREVVLRRLLTLVSDVEAEPWWDVTRWDVWYRIDHSLFGGVDFAADEDERSGYYRKMIDMNGTTREQIERIFADVAAADGRFAGKARGWDAQAAECLQQLRTLTQRIRA